MFRWLALLVLAPGLLLFAACGGDDDDGGGRDLPLGPGSSDGGSDDSPTRSSPGSNTNLGSCDVTVTGDIETAFSAPGGSSAFGTDYWLSEDELRSALEIFVGLGEDLSDDEKEAEIERILESGEVVLYLFLLNCEDPDSSNYIGIVPAGEATYDDVPFGPATYTIASGGILGGNPDATEFSALITIADPDGGEDLHFGVSEPGTFEITEWDDDNIAGRFSFRAEEGFAAGTPRQVTIEGEFDLRKP